MKRKLPRVLGHALAEPQTRAISVRNAGLKSPRRQALGLAPAALRIWANSALNAGTRDLPRMLGSALNAARKILANSAPTAEQNVLEQGKITVKDFYNGVNVNL